MVIKKPEPENRDVKIQLGERELTLTPNFKALCDIEEHFDLGFLKILQRFFDKEIGIGDLAVIVASFVKEEVTLEEIGEGIVEQGIAEVTVAVLEFLTPFATGLTAAGQEVGKAMQKSAKKVS